MSSHPQTHLSNAGSSTGTSAPTSGSQTITSSAAHQPSATLRLRGSSPATAPTASSPRVQWAEDVIDNEGMGKKSSKVCCIYHKPHEAGDSESDSSSSSSGEDSGNEEDLSRARKAGGSGRRGRRGHEHGHGGGDGEGKERKPSPNAYERQPKYKGKGKGREQEG